ncbi:ABC transporter substrate-binding protein [Streptococcus suis]|uniref:ABC transporter substrate-binding protein n=1 Tax=Streptococcus suis TaxID=1307 RepID=UPI000CF5E858|nr:sugar ABC transporter substrate-binding protein [Streptococcus suis]
MRKSFKIFLKSIMVVAGTAALLAACGTKNADSDKTILTYASWDTDQATGLRKVLDEFEKENPTIEVKMETTPWDQYWLKLEAATTGGNMADVVTMHSTESNKYMSAGMLMNLDELVESKDVDLTNYTEGIADFYTYNGSLYGIPKDTSTVGLWYNKELFDQAGVAYPDENWTWEDFRQAAIKLTDTSKGIYGFAAENAPETGYWPFIFQNEGKVYSDDQTKSELNSEAVAETMQFYTDLINVDRVSPTVKELQETNRIARFQAGKVAMIIEGNWHATNMLNNEYTKKNAAVAVLPKGKVRATVTNGLAWAASANTKHPEEVKKLMKFLASEKANKIQAEEGVSIPAYKGLGGEWVQSIQEFDLQPFVDMIEYGVPRPYNKYGLKTETLEKEVMNDVFDGKKTVKEGLKEIAEGVNQILAE